MTSNQLSPAGRPTTSIATIVGGVVLAVVAVWIVGSLVLGIVFGILRLVIPLGLVAGGGYLLARQKTTTGAIAIALGLLLLVI